MLKKLALALPVTGPYMRRNAQLAASFGHSPGHFYSPIPDIEDVKAREARLWEVKTKEIPGINLNENEQLRLLDQLAQYYAEQPFPEHKEPGLRYYLANDYFSFSDGIFYYAMLRHLKPKRVVEIGSGFSSCVLLDTRERFLGSAVDCTFIDPNPERLYGLLRPEDAKNIKVIPRRLQDLDLAFLKELSAGDILFVDSSHVSKIGSEVHQIFFEILPALASGVYIHIHDVFYPFEYPKCFVYERWAWNELYLLRAFLCYNPEFQVRLFPSFLEKFHSERLKKTLPLVWRNPPIWPEFRGGSI